MIALVISLVLGIGIPFIIRKIRKKKFKKTVHVLLSVGLCLVLCAGSTAVKAATTTRPSAGMSSSE